MHPLERILAVKGMTKAEFARRVDDDYLHVLAVLHGHRRIVPRKWREPLVAMGVDYDALNAEYRLARAETTHWEPAS